VFRVLIVPIGIMKITKMIFNNEKIPKVSETITRLTESGLKVNQMIKTYKKFVFSRLDYSMMNSIASLTELEKVNVLIRKK
jgi:hypothetical protein